MCLQDLNKDVERNEGETRLFHSLILSANGSWFREEECSIELETALEKGEILVPASLLISSVTLATHLLFLSLGFLISELRD